MRPACFLYLVLGALLLTGCSCASRPSCAKMEKTARAILAKIPYPSNVQIVTSKTLPDGFAPNVRGRVTPVGNFPDAEGAVAYFFALGVGDALTNPSGVSRSVVRVDVLYMACDLTNSLMSFSTYVVFGNPNNASSPTDNYYQQGFFKFNSQGKVCTYDWTLKRLALTVASESNNLQGQDPIFGFQSQPAAAAQVAGSKAAAIAQLCYGVQALCTGNNTQYAGSVADCIAFNSNITFGSWDNADQNTVVCRQLHLSLATFNAKVHCPHTGPSTVGPCVDKPLSQVFKDNYLTCS